ncbi:hypothetical protein OG824_37005 [Streptomyces prunicolor]|uniref:hypothetical protein n=1 Tax=Streptomyces prunicolor TaxID=67348 RepID=UPI0022538699|nr:hypothetical protein [Streptomyces prunicolor]MCX5240826.1 hypothetical protein [Streptomyces prunicolor]
MTARTVKKEELHLPPETGWAKARRRNGKAVRTCIPPVEDNSVTPPPRMLTEGNIVRGDD